MSMDPVMRGVNPGIGNQPVQNVCESIAIVEEKRFFNVIAIELLLKY